MLSNSYEGMYRCQAQEDSAGALETHYAANGTPVHMRANVLVSVAFEVVTGVSGKKKTQSFKLACCIGDVSHNIFRQLSWSRRVGVLFSHQERHTSATRTLERSLVMYCCGEEHHG